MIDGKRVGLAISSYITNGTTYNRLRRCVSTLITSSTILDQIVIVDDGSFLNQACTYYKSLSPRVQIYYNCDNYGIAATKNRSLRLLDGNDIIILADNDVEFRRSWDKICVQMMSNAGLQSMALSSLFHRPSAYKKNMNGIEVGFYPNFQGALMFVTKEALNVVGGFPILPEKYGQEHSNWQHRLSVLGDHIGHVPDPGIGRYVFLKHDENSFTTADEKYRMSVANSIAEVNPDGLYLPLRCLDEPE